MVFAFFLAKKRRICYPKMKHKGDLKMILLEDASVEQDVLAGNAYIAVPMEIYQSISGETTLTVYSACSNIAHSYMAALGQDAFEKDLLAQTSGRIEAFMKTVGYTYDAEASQTILEYATGKEWHTPKIQSDHVIIIQTLDEWTQYKNETNAEPDFLDNGRSAAFVIVKNETIVSCACINDAFYTNGAVEIHVETAADYQERGYAASCTAALVSYFWQKGISVWYKCYENNSASAAVAEKCGLKLRGKRVSFVCYADV